MPRKRKITFYEQKRGQPDRLLKSLRAPLVWTGPGWASVRQFDVVYEDGTNGNVRAKNIIWTDDGENYWYLGTDVADFPMRLT